MVNQPHLFSQACSHTWWLCLPEVAVGPSFFPLCMPNAPHHHPSPGGSCIIGQNLMLLYLKLRLPDAETWMAYTATPSVCQLDHASIRDYILQSNGLVQRTPCDCTHSEISISNVDENLLTQLDLESIGTSSRSTIHEVTVYVQQSYTDLGKFLSVTNNRVEGCRANWRRKMEPCAWQTV